MVRQHQILPVQEVSAQGPQHLAQQRRQLRRVVRHVRVQPRRSAARRQYRHEGLVGAGVEAVVGHGGREQGGGGQRGEAGDAVGAECLGQLRDGRLGFEGVQGAFPGREVGVDCWAENTGSAILVI